ncbi:BnaC03g40760D [Brassica napus]|uniref:BnaC03g40760D protein n=1 Tax=Brassica napus TaxID=3708 RepID=A0A078GED7_BRANA|nr:BnaC03g40760D [Brassica napus]
MEDIEKTQTLSGKFVKIQAYIDFLNEEKSKIKDLDLHICKQFLNHAITALDVEHDIVSAEIKDILNQTGIADVDLLPKEMIRAPPLVNPMKGVHKVFFYYNFILFDFSLKKKKKN